MPVWRRIVDLIAGMLLILGMLGGFHAMWIGYGQGLDMIHRQETIARTQNVKAATVNASSTRIAEPRAGDPPMESRPAHASVMGWMWIPRFGAGWHRAIQEGTGLDVLNNYGIGHYETSVMPGMTGNSAYAGHRTMGDLGPANLLQPGDPIIIQTADRWYVYEMQKSWETTPDDVAVLDNQGDAKIITLTTCRDSLDLQDSLSHRFIVRGRFKYWANTADGIPSELAPKSDPISKTVARTVDVTRTLSVRAPMSMWLAAATGLLWLLTLGLGRLLAGRNRKRPATWNPMILLWRIQQGGLIGKPLGFMCMWLTVMFAQWAWLSPWLATLLPVFSGTGAMNM
ncbi:class E sortase [Bifidobacterium felsineum]|nr:class E sortase [Bifidobacterium felsineum]